MSTKTMAANVAKARELMPIELHAISTADLSRRARAVVEEVRQGRPAVVRSGGEEQVVLLDAVDYRLLRGFAGGSASLPEADLPASLSTESRAAMDYLSEKISLGKLAELFGISRFELMDRMHRLGIPLRLGPGTLEEARAEVEVAEKASEAARRQGS